VIGVQVGSPNATKQLGSLTGKRNGGVTAACPRESASLKPRQQSSGGPMSGIYMILVFVAVMAALNRFEFGRFD